MVRISRRHFAAGLGAAGLSVTSEARGAESDPNPPQILIAGDSMIAGGFGLFLERRLREDHGLHVVRRGKSSTGLARPDFFDWMKEAQALVAEGIPPVTIVMFGGNDVQGLYMGRGEDRSREWIRWPDEGWAQEYARRVVAFCDVFQPDDQHVVWVGLPIMRPDKFRARCEKVNTIYRAEMAIRKNAWFIDTWDVLADEDGNYADKIVLDPSLPRPKKVRVRAGDGIHLSPAGAKHLVDHVLERLLPLLEKAGVADHA